MENLTPTSAGIRTMEMEKIIPFALALGCAADRDSIHGNIVNNSLTITVEAN
jgi:hypothetical protein